MPKNKKQNKLRVPIRGAGPAVDLYYKLEDPKLEKMRGFFLDKNYMVLKSRAYAIGDLGECVSKTNYTQPGEILEVAIIYTDIRYIILVHSHIQHDCTPSDDDRILMREINIAAKSLRRVQLLDFVIVKNKKEFWSWAYQDAPGIADVE